MRRLSSKGWIRMNYGFLKFDTAPTEGNKNTVITRLQPFPEENNKMIIIAYKKGPWSTHFEKHVDKINQIIYTSTDIMCIIP